MTDERIKQLRALKDPVVNECLDEVQKAQDRLTRHPEADKVVLSQGDHSLPYHSGGYATVKEKP